MKAACCYNAQIARKGLKCTDVHREQSPQAMKPLEATVFYLFHYGWNSQANRSGQFTVKLIQNKHFHCIG